MVAWVLNLDADLELGGGPGYAPTKSVVAAMHVHAARLAETLLEPGDVWIETADARGMIGRAFCPTPRAIAALERAGAIPEPHPPIDVLRRVNARSFCVSGLPGARFVHERAEALEILAQKPPIGEHWRVKRNFGMAGRGQRVIRGASDLSFVTDDLQIEPNVTIEAEYAIHGFIGTELVLGRLVRQRCDATGTWISSELAHDEAVEARMHDEALAVATLLREAGYFGPFNVDAYAYSGGFNPRSEINARYSMAFPVGFQGKSRPSMPSSSLSPASRYSSNR
ncbi:MAG: hypothetical protein ACXWUG_28665 [Polyangiales bacterium]